MGVPFSTKSTVPPSHQRDQAGKNIHL
jgi:hypothetical protein